MNRSSFSRIIAGCSLLVVLAAGMAPLAGFSQVVGDPFKDITLGPPVRITSPANHAVFYAPVDIPIFVFTRSEVNFTNVELYANGVDIGSASSLAATNRPVAYFDYALPTPFVARFRSLWCLVWSNALAGAYALTAVTKGSFTPVDTPLESLSRTSAPVNITILSSTNGTNPTDFVNIIATDPIAIAGTNMSWVWAGLTNKVPAWTNWPPPRWGYFTNWGPKPALFTVRRFGDASDTLTVNYSIGGTASNGVDYAALPGSLNIPAGSGYGLIPVVPIDNGSNNLFKTVVLKLSASTNVPPDYDVGVPKQAEALIVYRWPRPIPILLGGVLPSVGGVLPDGAFHFSATGPDGAWFTLQNSTDLVNWTSICTNQVVQGSVDFIDPNTSGTSAGFYQVVTNAPPQ